MHRFETPAYAEMVRAFQAGGVPRERMIREDEEGECVLNLLADRLAPPDRIREALAAMPAEDLRRHVARWFGRTGCADVEAEAILARPDCSLTMAVHMYAQSGGYLWHPRLSAMTEADGAHVARHRAFATRLAEGIRAGRFPRDPADATLAWRPREALTTFEASEAQRSGGPGALPDEALAAARADMEAGEVETLPPSMRTPGGRQPYGELVWPRPDAPVGPPRGAPSRPRERGIAGALRRLFERWRGR
jgi:hypothetical protein